MIDIQRLSQGHLKILTECPRKFEHTYLDLLAAPLAPEQRTRMQWGSDFHRLMQQQELGLPIEPFLIADPQLGKAVHNLLAVAPNLFALDPQVTRDSEHVRTLLIKDYLFTAIYDLVILGTTAQIIDWKTYGKPRNLEQLAQDWQTRLYLYIMAETSNYAAAEISFTYWFVLHDPQPQSAEFAYSDKLHQQTHQELQQILQQLDRWLQDYRHQQHFPQVPIDSPLCPYCHFASRCDRLALRENQLPLVSPALALTQLNMAAISEIAI
jgi:PD-(D/E)XK nuclease superfamily